MKAGWCFIFVCWIGILQLEAQRKLPVKNREQKKAEKQMEKNENATSQSDIELRWNPRELPAKSKGYPEIFPWHSGSAGIIASHAAEINLFHPTRIGWTQKTEILFRIAEEAFLPNIGLKHRWWGNRRFALAGEHTLYYTYPGLKILQQTGFKDLVPDSLRIGQGFAMRHEVLFSWLMNPRILGCPGPSEKILTLRIGTEFGIKLEQTELKPFDYAYMLYHTQLLAGKVLYYGGLQFDSYFNYRFHYSLNGLFYSVDLKKEYAFETNLRLTYYLSRRFGISLAGKGSYMNIAGRRSFVCIPLLDVTYLVNPGRTVIKHGLSKKKKRRLSWE